MKRAQLLSDIDDLLFKVDTADRDANTAAAVDRVLQTATPGAGRLGYMYLIGGGLNTVEERGWLFFETFGVNYFDPIEEGFGWCNYNTCECMWDEEFRDDSARIDIGLTGYEGEMHRTSNTFNTALAMHAEGYILTPGEPLDERDIGQRWLYTAMFEFFESLYRLWSLNWQEPPVEAADGPPPAQHEWHTVEVQVSISLDPEEDQCSAQSAVNSSPPSRTSRRSILDRLASSLGVPLRSRR